MSKAFEVRVEQGERVAVLSVAGELDLAASVEFEASMGAVLVTNPAGVAVDLSNCEFIDSTGVRCLLSGQALATDRGAGYVLVLDSESQPSKVLSVTGCAPDRVPCFKSRGAAEAALVQSPRSQDSRTGTFKEPPPGG
jgi:anti-anti-sigma factor